MVRLLLFIRTRSWQAMVRSFPLDVLGVRMTAGWILAVAGMTGQ